MPEHNPGQMGGTMRLGKRRTIFKTNNSILRKKHSIHFEPSIGVFHVLSSYSTSVFQANFMEIQSMWMKGTDIALRYFDLSVHQQH